MTFCERSKSTRLMSGLVVLKRWTSSDGRYRVSVSKWTGSAVVARVWYAEAKRYDDGWDVISTHRKRGRAEQACHIHERQSQRGRR